MDTQFFGLVISSERPEALQRWYADALGGQIGNSGPVGWELTYGDVLIVFVKHSDIEGLAKEPKRILINFRVDDARVCMAHLERLGATQIRPVGPEPFGLLGTVTDPDGNYLQVAEVTTQPG